MNKLVYPKIYIGKTTNLSIEEIEKIISHLSCSWIEKLREGIIKVS